MKYRAKQFNTNRWIYGSLIYYHDVKVEQAMQILTYGNGIEKYIDVDRSTVGHYIDRCDVNGKEVYTDDIVEYFDWCYASKFTQEKTHLPNYNHNYDNPKRGNTIDGYYKPLTGMVKWNSEYMTYEPMICSCEDYNHNCFAYVCSKHEEEHRPNAYFKVIGNKHDNPELLESLK